MKRTCQACGQPIQEGPIESDVWTLRNMKRFVDNLEKIGVPDTQEIFLSVDGVKLEIYGSISCHPGMGGVPVIVAKER